MSKIDETKNSYKNLVCLNRSKQILLHILS